MDTVSEVSYSQWSSGDSIYYQFVSFSPLSPWVSNMSTGHMQGRLSLQKREREKEKGKTNLCEVKADRPVWTRDMAVNG